MPACSERDEVHSRFIWKTLDSANHKTVPIAYSDWVRKLTSMVAVFGIVSAITCSMPAPAEAQIGFGISVGVTLLEAAANHAHRRAAERAGSGYAPSRGSSRGSRNSRNESMPVNICITCLRLANTTNDVYRWRAAASMHGSLSVLYPSSILHCVKSELSG